LTKYVSSIKYTFSSSDRSIIFNDVENIQELKYIQLLFNFISETRQINVSKTGVSKLAIVVLAIIFAAGLFLVGFDQGHIFSLVYGEQAFEDLYIHELTHDMRHAAGFPCH
jgi:preprotein translocase subunit SecE